ncbi:hypothetical protein OIV83_003914 [Microbotryomycetes sp. JL201]|nr:hypothetical protein OIV83_003914 [Microbotryomycetes sp. JL201]
MALLGGPRVSDRPSDWHLASPDLNVLLTGRVLADNGTTVEFELADGGLYIEHAALVSVTCSPTTQVLASLNTGKPVLTLQTPLIPDHDTNATGHQDGEQIDSERDELVNRKPTVVTLHHPLMTFQEAQTSSQSPMYSTTFKILVDGEAFLPPRFDPLNLTPATPNVTGSAHILNSPTVHRALLSPLLSPQRRAASQGSDTSVPPLNLGVARARAPSITGQPQSQSTSSATALASTFLASSSPSTAAHAHLGVRRSSVATNGQQVTSGSTSARLSAQDDLTKYVEPNGRPSLDQVVTADVSAKAKTTAEEILNLRRQHDAFVKRAKAELDVLSARVTNAANAVSTAIVPGSGLVVRGFGATSANSASPSKSRSPADRRSVSSRDRSSARGESEERGRPSVGRGAAATGSSRNSEKDEQKSQEIRDEDERQEEERGRSRSRVRRGQDGEHGSQSQSRQQQQHKSTSKSRDKVAEVVAAVAASSAASPSRQTTANGPSSQSTPKLPQSPGEIIPASIDESEQPTLDDSASASAQQSGDRSATPIFVPSSHALVAIPETEELSLPPSEAGGDRTPDPRSSPQVQAQEDRGSGEDSGEFAGDTEFRELAPDEVNACSPDQDAPFEMDEDIDVEQLELEEPIADLDQHASDRDSSTIQQHQQGTDSSAFRVGSLRPTSTLSSSYAALLSSSSARQPPFASSYRPPSMASFKPDPMFPPHPSLSTRLSSSGQTDSPLDPEQVPSTATSARKDARVELDYIPSPDPKLVREGQSKIRQVLAMDAPSHRAPLPSRRRRPFFRSDTEQDEFESRAEGSVQATLTTSAPAHAVIGSLPISIGFARPTSTFRPPSERELERKTSVPSREGMFVVPLLRQEAKRRAQQQQQHPERLAPSPAASTVPIETGPSPSRPRQTSLSGQAGGLAQSLRQHPGNVRSFEQVLREEQEEEESVRRELQDERAAATGMLNPAQGSPDGRVHVDDDDDDDEEDFVPPHELLKNQRRKDEQFLSRSVQSDE